MSRLATVKTKYPHANWNVLKNFDPSKNYKYLEWLGKNYKFSSPEELKSLILEFEKRKDSLPEKDINKYSSESLTKELGKLLPSRKEQKEAGVSEIFHKDIPRDLKVYFIEGESAAKQYFAGTKWCISNFGTFIEYCRNGNIYLIISNGQKICIAFDGDYPTIFDPVDREIDPEELNFLFKFCGINANIIDICKKHNDKYQNFWMRDIKLDEKYISQLLSAVSKVEFAWEHLIDGGDKNVEDLIKFFFKNRENEVYKPIVNLMSRSKYKFYPANTRSYHDITIAAAWKALLNPKPESKKDEDLLKKIKKAGGLAKILKNKNILNSLAKHLKEEYPEV